MAKAVEVITSVERRRRWSRADKERIVAAAMEPGAVASEIARAAGIEPSQLFRWLQQLCERTQAPATLNPVAVTPESGPVSVPPAERRGGLIKVLWHDGQGMCLFAKRLERGRFLWPSPADGVVTISSAQLGYLLEGIDWRMPQETWRPLAAG